MVSRLIPKKNRFRERQVKEYFKHPLAHPTQKYQRPCTQSQPQRPSPRKPKSPRERRPHQHAPAERTIDSARLAADKRLVISSRTSSEQRSPPQCIAPGSGPEMGTTFAAYVSAAVRLPKTSSGMPGSVLCTRRTKSPKTEGAWTLVERRAHQEERKGSSKRYCRWQDCWPRNAGWPKAGDVRS